MGQLERVPGVQNWIERLPAALRAAWNRSIIYRAAVHMVNGCEHIVATGDVKQWPGPQQVNPKSVAECVDALAVWESMKAAAHAKKG